MKQDNTPPLLALIAARATNGVIGYQGKLPWHLSTDLKTFKKRTLDKPVLMGRKTWESLKSALSGRPNLVLTRKADYLASGAEVFTDFLEMLAHARNLAQASEAQEIIVMGGKALYSLALPYADTLYLTEVEARPKGDTWFPDFQEDEWSETERLTFKKTSKDDHHFIMRTLKRNL